MELTGEQSIAATCEQVWAGINDVEILMRCIPGCEDIRRISPEETHLRVAVKIGPVRARFAGKLRMSEIREPESFTMSFEGAGGAAGFAKGSSAVTLEPDGQGTRLRYSVSASVGGKLGQIGGRLIDASAQKMADQFFLEFKRAMSGEAPGGGTTSQEGASPTVATKSSATTAQAGLQAPSTSELPGQHWGPAAGHPTSAQTFGGSFRGELQRAFWFVLGVGSTLLTIYMSR